MGRQNKSLYRIAGCSLLRGFVEVYRIQSGHSELSVISQMSAVEGCLLSRGSTVYRYTIIQAIQDFMINLKAQDYTKPLTIPITPGW